MIQFCNPQQFVDVFAWIHKLELTRVTADGGQGADKFAEASAVYKFDVRQVQDDAIVSGLRKS